MRRSKKLLIPMLMVRSAIMTIHQTITTITRNNSKIIPNSKSQISSSSNNLLLPNITIINIANIPMITRINRNHMITVHTATATISISTMLIAHTVMIMITMMKLRKRKRKNAITIILLIIIIIIQQYRREISRVITPIEMLIWKGSAKRSQ